MSVFSACVFMACKTDMDANLGASLDTQCSASSAARWRVRWLWWHTMWEEGLFPLSSSLTCRGSIKASLFWASGGRVWAGSREEHKEIASTSPMEDEYLLNKVWVECLLGKALLQWWIWPEKGFLVAGHLNALLIKAVTLTIGTLHLAS